MKKLLLAAISTLAPVIAITGCRNHSLENAPQPGASSAPATGSSRIGEIAVEVNLVGGNHRIIVDFHGDPDVPGVACYVSRALAVGWAEEDARGASIACIQVGEISFPRPLARHESIFEQGPNPPFKNLHFMRMVDVERNTLVYLAFSNKLVDGAPRNSVTAVPVSRSTPIPLMDQRLLQ